MLRSIVLLFLWNYLEITHHQASSVCLQLYYNNDKSVVYLSIVDCFGLLSQDIVFWGRATTCWLDLTVCSVVSRLLWQSKQRLSFSATANDSSFQQCSPVLWLLLCGPVLWFPSFLSFAVEMATKLLCSLEFHSFRLKGFIDYILGKGRQGYIRSIM